MLVICWAITRASPDLRVQCVIENAGTTLEHFRTAMSLALGVPEDRVEDHLLEVDTIRWAPFPRKRIFISTLPPPSTLGLPSRRPDPWEPGAAPRRDARLGPMMRSRGAPGGARHPVAY